MGQARGLEADLRGRVPGRLLPGGTVLGWERVRVPAGEFGALKVRRNVLT
jgi:hypothetical protein